MTSFTFTPIGIVHSPFGEKFGIPRQSGLVSAARATLELLPPFDRDEALRALEGFSHLWLVFVFHGIPAGEWKPTVRPPRLGGNTRVGVFATRSTFRPNPIGLSVVKLEGIGRERGKLILHLGGVDLLDGTPVLDIKPYLPYADAVQDAGAAFAEDAPARLEVMFTPEAAAACHEYEATRQGLTALIEGVLAQDPRPAYRDKTNDDTEYGVALHGLNIRWRVAGGCVWVVAVTPVGAGAVGAPKWQSPTGWAPTG